MNPIAKFGVCDCCDDTNFLRADKLTPTRGFVCTKCYDIMEEANWDADVLISTFILSLLDLGLLDD